LSKFDHEELLTGKNDEGTEPKNLELISTIFVGQLG
jgi:hypothetical protein